MDRPSEVSGLFYPKSAKDLKTMMANFLKRSNGLGMNGKLIGVVVPRLHTHIVDMYVPLTTMN